MSAISVIIWWLIVYSLLTHGSSVGRFGSHCNRSVAMENQHALRESVRISRAIYCTAQLFSTEVRGSGHNETNARTCLERVNVPKSLTLKGWPTETNYTIVRGTLYTWIGTVWLFGSLWLNQFCGHEKSWSTSRLKTRAMPMPMLMESQKKAWKDLVWNTNGRLAS